MHDSRLSEKKIEREKALIERQCSFLIQDVIILFSNSDGEVLVCPKGILFRDGG